jgi:hypothetical protein
MSKDRQLLSIAQLKKDY